MRKILNNTIVLILLVIIMISVYKIYKIFYEYKENREVYKEIIDIVTKEDEKFGITSKEYLKLKEINEDYLFWLYIPKTEISYPVVRSKNNEEYLYKNFNKEKNKGGSIFLDCKNELEDRNLIIHGHNMKDKSMFGTLSNLLDSNYLNENKKIYIYLEGKVLEYEIFSAYVTNGKEFQYKMKFDDDEEFNEYINYIISKSFYKFDYEKEEGERIITLSTCTNVSSVERTIVNAKLKSVKSTMN